MIFKTHNTRPPIPRPLYVYYYLLFVALYRDKYLTLGTVHK
jgi:hypothetical protein